MLICRRPLLFASDALGVAGVVAVLAAMAWGVIFPWQQAAQARPVLQAETVTAAERYQTVTTRNRELADTIRAFETALADLSAQRERDPSEFLEFAARECTAAGFQLQQLTPQGVVKHAEHRSWDAQLRVAGPFAAFPALLDRIERWSPFTQVRDLAITGPAESLDGKCQFSWTVRVNFLAPSSARPEAAPR